MFCDYGVLSRRHNRGLPGSQRPGKFCGIQCCASGSVQHLLLATLSLTWNTWKIGRWERLFWYLHAFKEGIAMRFTECRFVLLLWPVRLLGFWVSWFILRHVLPHRLARNAVVAGGGCPSSLCCAAVAVPKVSSFLCHLTTSRYLFHPLQRAVLALCNK